jgi:hypothetical protein
MNFGGQIQTIVPCKAFLIIKNYLQKGKLRCPRRSFQIYLAKKAQDKSKSLVLSKSGNFFMLAA